MSKKQIKDIIHENRKRLGLTQEQLAENLNVSNKTVSKWETGKSYPDVLLIPELAKELGISVTQFFGLEVKENVIGKAEDLPTFRSKDFLKCRLAIIYSIFMMVFSPIIVLISWVLQNFAFIIIAIFIAVSLISVSLLLVVVNTIKMHENIKNTVDQKSTVIKYKRLCLIYVLIWYIYLMGLSPVAMALFNYEPAMIIFAITVHVLFSIIPQIIKYALKIQVKVKKNLALIAITNIFTLASIFLFAFTRVISLYLILYLLAIQIICYVIDFISKEEMRGDL